MNGSDSSATPNARGDTEIEARSPTTGSEKRAEEILRRAARFFTCAFVAVREEPTCAQADRRTRRTLAGRAPGCGGRRVRPRWHVDVADDRRAAPADRR